MTTARRAPEPAPSPSPSPRADRRDRPGSSAPTVTRPICGVTPWWRGYAELSGWVLNGSNNVGTPGDRGWSTCRATGAFGRAGRLQRCRPVSHNEKLGDGGSREDTCPDSFLSTSSGDALMTDASVQTNPSLWSLTTTCSPFVTTVVEPLLWLVRTTRSANVDAPATGPANGLTVSTPAPAAMSNQVVAGTNRRCAVPPCGLANGSCFGRAMETSLGEVRGVIPGVGPSRR